MNTPRLRYACAATALALAGMWMLSPGTAHAQNNERSLRDLLNAFSADLSIPTSPATALAGLSPEAVIQPRNRREFEAGITNLYDGSGRPSGSLQFLPYYIVRGGKMPFKTYRDSMAFRALTKTSLGLASGTREIDGHKVGVDAVSLSTTLLDLADPIYYGGLVRCIDETVKNNAAAREQPRAGRAQRSGEAPPLLGNEPSQPFADTDEIKDEQMVADYKQCLAQFRPEAMLWNRSKVAFGVATGSGHEKQGEARAVRLGRSVWATALYGFEDFALLRKLDGQATYYDCEDSACSRQRVPSRLERLAQLSVHMRYTADMSNLDLATAGELPKGSRKLLGARFTYGSDKRAVFLEWSRDELSSAAERRRTNLHALGASFRVSDNLWVNLVSGRRKQYLNDQLESVLGVNLQLGAASEPLVATAK